MTARKMPEINHEIFAQNLLLTQAYCEMQLANTEKSVAEILRSFNPKCNGQKVFTFKPGEHEGETMTYFEAGWSVDPWRDDDMVIYNDLFDQQLANKMHVVKLDKRQTSFKGKILIAEVDNTVVDGCSEAHSDGLIDIFDCPPIDTWFYFTKNEYSRLIYCWIPEKFEGQINIAVAVNATDCLRWFEGTPQ
ncbi:hypothetical protein [Mucilaginibacter psychrotolerans]|uniref:Uncharacterized protein n=1 Tax=Mucilaginibacter psychrotolerans TaxID=1524096 RepID=A0A4Y8SBI7_9SPHI|nr:hypothetical protein [Mucilaginibacter psychrotolerans]TFF35960.1 hypothetical protein E2R66_17225 [Mucilaginibacter psychrotolerans]